MVTEYEEQYEREYGVPSDLDSIGLRRHIVDVGPRYLVAISGRRAQHDPRTTS